MMRAVAQAWIGVIAVKKSLTGGASAPLASSIRCLSWSTGRWKVRMCAPLADKSTSCLGACWCWVTSRGGRVPCYECINGEVNRSLLIKGSLRGIIYQTYFNTYLFHPLHLKKLSLSSFSKHCWLLILVPLPAAPNIGMMSDLDGGWIEGWAPQLRGDISKGPHISIYSQCTLWFCQGVMVWVLVAAHCPHSVHFITLIGTQDASPCAETWHKLVTEAELGDNNQVQWFSSSAEAGMWSLAASDKIYISAKAKLRKHLAWKFARLFNFPSVRNYCSNIWYLIRKVQLQQHTVGI